MNPELLAYIKQRIAAGISPENIANELKSANWKDEDIASAFPVVNSQIGSIPNIPVAPANPQVKKVAESQSLWQEKKHDAAWVVINILLRGGIIGGVTYLALLSIMAIFGASMVVSNPSHFKDLLDEGVSGGGSYFAILGILFYLTAIVTSLLGYQWGCRYVQKRTLIEQKDFFKIGYWIGLVPVVLNLLSFASSTKVPASGVIGVIVGIFILPPLVRRWLTDGLDAAMPKQARDRKVIWATVGILLLMTIGGFYLLAGQIRADVKNGTGTQTEATSTQPGTESEALTPADIPTVAELVSEYPSSTKPELYIAPTVHTLSTGKDISLSKRYEYFGISFGAPRSMSIKDVMRTKASSTLGDMVAIRYNDGEVLAIGTPLKARDDLKRGYEMLKTIIGAQTDYAYLRGAFYAVPSQDIPGLSSAQELILRANLQAKFGNVIYAANNAFYDITTAQGVGFQQGKPGKEDVIVSFFNKATGEWMADIIFSKGFTQEEIDAVLVSVTFVQP
ncbi:MAG: hypothetical protein RL681_584 [Candidatus Parcubacteria bacterium]